MSHWADPVARILTADTGDLKDLARIAGQDPKYFFRYQSLAGCDLRGQDLSGLDLTGTNIDQSIIDHATQIDIQFDPRRLSYNEYIPIRISSGLNVVVLAFSDEMGYSYNAWAYKALIARGVEAADEGNWDFYEQIILDNQYFEELVNSSSKIKSIKTTVQVYIHLQRMIEQLFDKKTGGDIFGWIILVGALRYKIPPGSRKDYSGVLPTSLFKSRRGAMPNDA